jgi:hypothetical protein
MGRIEDRCASFDKLRMRRNLHGPKKNLMLSLSKHARCRSPSPVEPSEKPYAIAPPAREECADS